MKRSATVVLLLMGVAACDDDRETRAAECTTEADSDVDCIRRSNTVGHTYFYNGHHYSCAWYNHSAMPASTYVPAPSPAYAARSASAARAGPAPSSRGGFGATGSGGSS